MPAHRFLLLAVLLFGATTFLHADDQPSPVETKLREALRNSMLAARDAQNQIVTLQAAQAQSDKDNADLKTKVDALTTQLGAATKQSASDKAASDAAIGALKTQIDGLNDQLKKYSDALEAWKKDDAEKTALAAIKEAARADLAGQVISLRRLLEDREMKNHRALQDRQTKFSPATRNLAWATPWARRNRLSALPASSCRNWCRTTAISCSTT